MLQNDLYKVKEISCQDEVSSLVANIKLNPTHAIFQGHFPDMPVLPGVCQVHICGEILALALKEKLQLSEANSIKFLAFINPNEISDFDVSIQWIKSENSYTTNASINHEEKVFLKMRATYLIVDSK